MHNFFDLAIIFQFKVRNKWPITALSSSLSNITLKYIYIYIYVKRYDSLVLFCTDYRRLFLHYYLLLDSSHEFFQVALNIFCHQCIIWVINVHYGHPCWPIWWFTEIYLLWFTRSSIWVSNGASILFVSYTSSYIFYSIVRFSVKYWIRNMDTYCLFFFHFQYLFFVFNSATIKRKW